MIECEKFWRRVMKKGGYFALLCAVVLFLAAFTSKGFGGSTMVEKNLFAPERKPPSPEAVEAPPQKNQPGVSIKAIQLDGVLIHGSSRKALIRHKGKMPGGNNKKGESPYSTVQEGEAVGDYKVVKINSKSITLEKDGKQEEVNLFAEGKVVPPAPRLPQAPLPNAQQESPPPTQARGNMAPGSQPPPVMEGNDPANRLPQLNNPAMAIVQPPGGQPMDGNQPGVDEGMAADELVNDDGAGSAGDGQ
jgi:hypothetical protein